MDRSVPYRIRKGHAVPPWPHEHAQNEGIMLWEAACSQRGSACSLQVRILDAFLQVALFARPAQDPNAVLDIGHDDVVVGPGLRVRDVFGGQGLEQLHTFLVKPAQAQTSIGGCSVLSEFMTFEQPSSLMAMAQALPGCLS